MMDIAQQNDPAGQKAIIKEQMNIGPRKYQEQLADHVHQWISSVKGGYTQPPKKLKQRKSPFNIKIIKRKENIVIGGYTQQFQLIRVNSYLGHINE